MKVTIERTGKRLMTLEQIDNAKHVITICKEDDWTPANYASLAARGFLKGLNVDDFVDRVMEAEATAQPRRGAWNVQSENSGDIDVVIRATVRTARGFIEMAAWLSDIWQISAGWRPDNKENYFGYYTRTAQA